MRVLVLFLASSLLPTPIMFISQFRVKSIFSDLIIDFENIVYFWGKYAGSISFSNITFCCVLCLHFLSCTTFLFFLELIASFFICLVFFESLTPSSHTLQQLCKTPSQYSFAYGQTCHIILLVLFCFSLETFVLRCSILLLFSGCVALEACSTPVTLGLPMASN